jgi:hypothetical protein
VTSCVWWPKPPSSTSSFPRRGSDRLTRSQRTRRWEAPRTGGVMTSCVWWPKPPSSTSSSPRGDYDTTHTTSTHSTMGGAAHRGVVTSCVWWPKPLIVHVINIRDQIQRDSSKLDKCTTRFDDVGCRPPRIDDLGCLVTETPHRHRWPCSQNSQRAWSPKPQRRCERRRLEEPVRDSDC